VRRNTPIHCRQHAVLPASAPSKTATCPASCV
jgi:hypothetical protein